MADGSPQTIDRIQVEIALNTATLDRDLQSVNTQIDSTKTKLGSLETSSCSTSECLNTLGSSTEKAQNELAKFPDTSRNAENALKALQHTSELAESGVEKTGDAVKATGSAFDKAGDAIEDASEFTDEFRKGAEKLTRPLENVKKGVEKFSSALKFSGVAAAAALAFNIIVGEVEKARAAVKQTYDEINNLETALSKLSAGGKISIEDKIFIDQVASTTTNPEDLAYLYDYIGDTLVSVPKTIQQEIADTFNKSGQANNINPTTLYQSVAQALLASGISPNEEPQKLIDLLNKLVTAYQHTGVDISTLLKTVKEYLPKLEGTDLSLEDLIIMGASSSAENFGDTTAFTAKLDELISKSQEAYDAVIKNSATNAGYDDTEDYLDSLPDDMKQSVIEGAEQASKENATTMAAGIKDGFASIDWVEAGTIIGESSAKAQYYDSLTDDEKNEQFEKLLNKTSTIYGDENGKFGIFDVLAGVESYGTELKGELLKQYGTGEIDQATYHKFANELKTQIAEAQAQVWLDVGKTNIGGYSKSGGEYLQERIDLSGMTAAESIAYRAGIVLEEVGNDLVERANFDKEVGLYPATTDTTITTGDAMSKIGVKLTTEALKSKTVELSAELSIDGEEGTATQEAAKKQLGIDKPLTAQVNLEVVQGETDTASGELGKKTETVSDIVLETPISEMENLGAATADAAGIMEPFMTDTIEPLNTLLAEQGETLTSNYDATVLLNDTSVNVTVPTIQTEGSYVQQLTDSYWQLYYAKLAAASV